MAGCGSNFSPHFRPPSEVDRYLDLVRPQAQPSRQGTGSGRIGAAHCVELFFQCGKIIKSAQVGAAEVCDQLDFQRPVFKVLFLQQVILGRVLDDFGEKTT